MEPSVYSSNDLSVVSTDTSRDTTGDRSINSSKDLTPPIGNGGVAGGVKYILIVVQFKFMTSPLPFAVGIPLSGRHYCNI